MDVVGRGLQVARPCPGGCYLGGPVAFLKGGKSSAVIAEVWASVLSLTGKMWWKIGFRLQTCGLDAKSAEQWSEQTHQAIQHSTIILEDIVHEKTCADIGICRQVYND